MIRAGWLVSYAGIMQDRRRWPLAKAAAQAGVPLVIDSGAFSAHNVGIKITPFGLNNWLAKTGAWKLAEWVAALDVIGDPDTTMRNWILARNRGIKNAIPTVHFQTDASWVHRYADKGCDRLAVGGIVPVLRGSRGTETDKLRRWLDPVIQATEERGIKVHGFGVNTQWLIETYRLDSVDATSFASGVRFGRVPVLHSNGRIKAYPVDGMPTEVLHVLEECGVSAKVMMDGFNVAGCYPRANQLLHASLLGMLAAYRSWTLVPDGIAYVSDWSIQLQTFVLNLLRTWAQDPDLFATTLDRYTDRMRSVT
jgi:hypothetical protein